MSKHDDTQQRPDSLTIANDGRSSAMMVFSLLRPGGVFFQRLVFALGRRWPRTGAGKITGMLLIHFARLAIIQQFPDYGQGSDQLRQPLQLFESNYNGTFDDYIDSFVDAIPWDMRAFWGTSYGFPWRLRLASFKRYIRANEFGTTAKLGTSGICHYYVAYPEATARMIGSALRVAEVHAGFRQRALRLEPDEFAEHYGAFLTTVQEDL